MPLRPLRVLILCTGNSARSILGEYLLRDRGGPRFEVHSAGAAPSGKVHPMALRVLREVYRLDPAGARSKSWDELRSVELDLVITVCGHARETCPVFPGRVVKAHWGSPDPAAFEGSEEEVFAEFARVGREIESRVERLCALPVEKMSRLELGEELSRIGEG